MRMDGAAAARGEIGMRRAGAENQPRTIPQTLRARTRARRVPVTSRMACIGSGAALYYRGLARPEPKHDPGSEPPD